MATLTLIPVEPIAVIGNLRRRTYSITSSINAGDTATIIEFSYVMTADFIGATPGDASVALSGVGNRTLTFNMLEVADITGGQLTITGQ